MSDRYSATWKGSSFARGNKKDPLRFDSAGGESRLLWRSPRHVREFDPPKWDHRNDTPWCNGYDYHNRNCMNAALSSFDDEVASMQQWAVDWAERRKAIDLATVQAARMARFARALVSRNPKALKKAFGRTPRNAASNIPGLWIEYQFAIKPTVLGIYDACTILGQKFPVVRIRKTADDSYSYDDHQYGSYHRYHTGKTKAIVSAEIVAIDPHLYLLEMTGLTNPLNMGWEMIPFSWAVDYFTNVGDWLRNFQPRHPGVTFRRAYHTFIGEGSVTERVDRASYIRDDNPAAIWHAKGYRIERRLGLPHYTLQQPSLDDLSPGRLANLLSVTAIILKGKTHG